MGGAIPGIGPAVGLEAGKTPLVGAKGGSEGVSVVANGPFAGGCDTGMELADGMVLVGMCDESIGGGP